MDWTKIPYTKEIIQKQCEFANIEFNSIDFDNTDWWYENTWTSEQEELFKNWFIDYLYNNSKAGKEIIAFSFKRNKKRIESTWNEWNLMYGFRIKED